jgi:hypothetical protein
MADLIGWIRGNPALVATIAAAGIYFWPQLRSAFAGGIPQIGVQPRDEFLSTVDSARDLINHLDAAGDEEGAAAARKAAARLFEPEAKAK